MDPKSTMIAGAIGLALSAAWFGFRYAKRRLWEREVRENARRKAEAEKTETTADDDAEATIGAELKKGPGKD